jgi:hypothetical protein
LRLVFSRTSAVSAAVIDGCSGGRFFRGQGQFRLTFKPVESRLKVLLGDVGVLTRPHNRAQNVAKRTAKACTD